MMGFAVVFLNGLYGIMMKYVTRPVWRGPMKRTSSFNISSTKDLFHYRIKGLHIVALGLQLRHRAYYSRLQVKKPSMNDDARKHIPDQNLI